VIENTASLIILYLGALVILVGVVSAILNQFSFWAHREQYSNEKFVAGITFSFLPILFPKFNDEKLQKSALFRAKLFVYCVPVGLQAVILTLVFEGVL
jgi:hypothetical protein